VVSAHGLVVGSGSGPESRGWLPPTPPLPSPQALLRAGNWWQQRPLVRFLGGEFISRRKFAPSRARKFAEIPKHRRENGRLVGQATTWRQLRGPTAATTPSATPGNAPAGAVKRPVAPQRRWGRLEAQLPTARRPSSLCPCTGRTTENAESAIADLGVDRCGRKITTGAGLRRRARLGGTKGRDDLRTWVER
jgi:hypothetical protein